MIAIIQCRTPFIGSHGWLHNLMKVRKLCLKNVYPVSCMTAMDEEAFWMDMPASTTLDIGGTCSIPIKMIGHEKSRFTVCLAVHMDERCGFCFV